MTTKLLLALLPGLCVFGMSFDARANLDVGATLSAKSIKADSLGSVHLVTRFSAAAGDASPSIAHVVSTLTDYGGPAPLDNPITSPLVWDEAESGDQTFASVLYLEEGAIGESYTVNTSWYDALGNLLGEDESQVTVEAPGLPPIALEVLNPADEYGDVVLLKGDLVQVDFAVGCDFPWLAEACDAQQAQSSNKDVIQLMTSDGEVVAKTKRGKKLQGSLSLKAKTLAAEALVVGYLRKASGDIGGTSDTQITVVADPSTAELIGRTTALEAQVAALQAQVEALSSDLENATAAIEKNGAAGAENADAIQAHHGVLMKHLQLFSDEKISFRVSQNESGVATNANAIEEIAAKHISDAFDFESSIEELDQYIQGQGKLIATNTGGVATNAGSLEEIAAKHISDAFDFESSIEELDEYIQGQGKLIATNTDGIATNTAAIADGLGPPQANYEAIIRGQAVKLVDGEPARMTFAHERFVLTGVPVGDFDAIADGYRHLTEVSIVDVTGDGADSPFEVALWLTGDVPGVQFADGAALTFPNVTSAPPGATISVFSFNHDAGHFVGTGFVTDEGAVFATVQGVIEFD